MKVIEISAIWCSSCLVMQKTWNAVKHKFSDIEWISYDLDFDEEAKEYQVGNQIPILILEQNGKEKSRLIGEKNESEVVEWLNQNSI